MTAVTRTPTPEHRPADPDGAVAFSPPASSTDPPPRFVGPDADGHVAFSAPSSTAGRSTLVVYVLLPQDPDDPRAYVGMTTLPLQVRLQNHVGSRTHAPTSRYTRWMREEKAAGTRPIIAATTFATEGEAMAAFREAGYDVVNSAAGGFGRTPRAWTAEEDALLGRNSDSHVAQFIGVSEMTVNRRRRALGIPTFSSTARAASRPSPAS